MITTTGRPVIRTQSYLCAVCLLVPMTKNTHTVYTDVNTFRRDALPVLKQDLTLNTVCLSELDLIKHDDVLPGTYMAIYQCGDCNNRHSCVVLSAGSRGGSHRVYMSESVCSGLAQYLIQQEKQQEGPFTSLTAVDKVAELVADELGYTGRQINNIMILPADGAAGSSGPPSNSTSAAAGASTAATKAGTKVAAATAAAAAAGLSLRLLSRDCEPDVSHVMQWSTTFFKEVTGSQAPPPEIIKAFVLPWLTEGQYSVAVRDDNTPVCMLCHVATCESSCRVVWVYTPPEHRRQGHARQAVAKLCLQLKDHYEHISLLVSNKNLTAIRVYQDIGFVDAGVLVVADKPGYHFGHAIPKKQEGEADAAHT